ncbi:MAG: transglycosylase domain-containing protein [Clostridia bacterium]|nr:transglycosylase domain-containing protein [Clostridia bacterium]
MKKFINVILILIVISMIFATVASAGAGLLLSDKAELEINAELVSSVLDDSKTVLYYYEGGDVNSPKILTENLSSSSSKYVFTPISKIPQSMIDAFIAIEDKRFYSHHGVDFLRSGKAIANYIFRRSSSFGASTITQQVIKNLTGQSQRTPTRKINEIFQALNLEKKYSKDEILEIYLNIINLSNGCTGVGAAAEYYFSKAPSELSLEEISTIAAITNNPSLYDPIRHPENTVKRRDTVLLCMYEQGYITETEYTNAKASGLVLNIKESGTAKNSWFVETVISDLVDEYTAQGYSRQYAYGQIFHGGLQIFTTVNPEIQNILESYYESLGDRLITDRPAPQSSMIIMDQYNGDILGIVGATGKKQGELLQNYATDTRRPPGSAIKPLSVYAPLIDSGEINWASIIEDSPVTQISGKDWPQNANRKYRGDIDISDALANSVNTAAVKLLYRLGEEESLAFLKDNLHIESLVSPSKNAAGDANAVSLALGQTLHGITLRELVSAYSIFSDGNMSRARSYYKVTDKNGNIIFDNRQNQEAVIRRESADIMTKLLEGVVEHGTAAGKISLDEKISVAGKTGTTQGNCDRLFVGYTPSLLGGVWCGYDYPEPISPSLGNPSIKIWDEVMSLIYQTESYQKAPKQFNKSDKVQKQTYNKKTGEFVSWKDTDEDTAEGWFIAE